MQEVQVRNLLNFPQNVILKWSWEENSLCKLEAMLLFLEQG